MKVAVMAMIFCTAFCNYACAQEPITVTKASVNQKVVLVSASLNGKPVELECIVGISICSSPKPGQYTLVKIPAGAGQYMDCVNVQIYNNKSLEKKETRKIGDFCLLESN